MPYIKKEAREYFENEIDRLSSKIQNTGELNYIIYSLLCRLSKDKPSYRLYSALLAELECCKLEFYRKKVVPYEELKLIENGDVK